MKKVWLDTNFLMLPVQFKVDLFGELERLMNEPFEVVVPSGAVGELRIIAARGTKDGAAARVALKIVDAGRAKVVESSGKVDDWLVEKAGEGDVVCTNDLELIRRLREIKVRRIQLRGKNHLDFAY